MKKIVTLLTTLFLLHICALPTKASNNIPEEILSLQGNIKYDTNTFSEPQSFSASESGPRVAILSDSISTYKGYSLWGTYFYDESLMSIYDTWWGRYINDIGGHLTASETLGSSSITWNGQNIATYYDKNSYMASDFRINRLAYGGTPDVILFFGGTNDFYWRPQIGTYNPNQIGLVDTFTNAYHTALFKMRTKYPSAKIICITPFRIRESPDSDLDYYCNAIHAAATIYNAQVIDLRKAGLEEIDCYDGIHPNKSGMNKIYGMISQNAPPIKCEYITSHISDGVLKATATVSGTYSNEAEYKWDIINTKNTSQKITIDWSPQQDITWHLVQSGQYQINVTIRDKDKTYSTASTVATGSAEFDVNGIYIPNINRLTISAGVNISPNYSNKEFEWQYYDCQEQKWYLIQNWSPYASWINWTPPKSGSYWLHCRVRSTITGHIISSTNGFYYTQPKEFHVNGIYIPTLNTYKIKAGVNVAPDYTSKEFRWQYYDVKQKNWFLLSDWQSKSNWITFELPKNGVYWLHCEVRSQKTGLIESCTTAFNYSKPTFTTNGIYIPQFFSNKLSAGINLSSYTDNDYRWLYYDLSTKKWHTIKDWDTSSNWTNWLIPHKGTFLLYCEARNPYGQCVDYAVGIHW